MKQSIIITVLLCMSCMFTNAQSKSSENVDLSTTDKQLSSEFKNLKGNNRLATFSKLKGLINVKGATNGGTTSSTRIGAKTATYEQIVALLGEPDFKIQQTIIQYNLKSTSSACKAVIGINANKEVVFCTIKDCN